MEHMETITSYSQVLILLPPLVSPKPEAWQIIRIRIEIVKRCETIWNRKQRRRLSPASSPVVITCLPSCSNQNSFFFLNWPVLRIEQPSLEMPLQMILSWKSQKKVFQGHRSTTFYNSAAPPNRRKLIRSRCKRKRRSLCRWPGTKLVRIEK